MKNLLAKRVKKNNKGFTLVELIIVIAIIAILVAVLAPNYVRYVDRSRWSSDRNDCEALLSEVKTAVIETQNEGKTVSAEDIVITATKKPALSKNADLKAELASADPNWDQITVKHKQKQSIPGSTDEDLYPKYKISISSDGKSVTGTWVKEANKDE